VKRLLPTLIALAALGILLILIQLGYAEAWTGFGPYLDADGKAHGGKTLWDWQELLIVPVVLALGAWFLDGSRKASDARIEADRQRQATLDAYFQSMTAMLLEGKLIGAAALPVARSVARTLTLVTLRALDGGRKAHLLQFLQESGLVGPTPVVQLNGADFNGAELDESTLVEAELRGVYFQRACFRGATLIRADLRGSDFTGADFTGADMEGANLTHANLTGATITKEQRDSAIGT
jgi:hypothetical protein